MHGMTGYTKSAIRAPPPKGKAILDSLIDSFADHPAALGLPDTSKQAS
jgi:hypothetical protein